MIETRASGDVVVSAGRIDVWVAGLDVADGVLAGLEADLSQEELERASRLRFEEHRRRFVAAHGFLRRVLARRLGCAPDEVAFAVGPNGKPRLAVGSALRFNLAHSDGLAVCAVADEREVGVDVERVRRVGDVDRLAHTVLSKRELAELARWGPDRVDEGFLTAWTRKEAVLKARGEGLGRDLATVEVSLDPAAPASLLEIVGEPGTENRWSLHALEAAPGYVAAVAGER